MKAKVKQQPLRFIIVEKCGSRVLDTKTGQFASEPYPYYREAAEVAHELNMKDGAKPYKHASWVGCKVCCGV